jgi:hypothetical protein
MFQGPPRPISPGITLHQLLEHSRPSEPLGAWIQGSASRLHIHKVERCVRLRVLASTDLGFLLGRCAEIAVREGERAVILPAEMVIHWRALQVATAMPYLPDPQRLRGLFPGMHLSTSGFVVPLLGESPEAVLALCRAEGVGVCGSRVIYDLLPSQPPVLPIDAVTPAGLR